MDLRKHDLLQMDDEWLKKLSAKLLLEVSKRLLHDVKELQDRLNQNPDNSSLPPTSRVPWAKSKNPEAGQEAPAETDTAAVAAGGATEAAEATAETAKLGGKPASAAKASHKKPGKQPGSQGYGRTQKLAVTATCHHRPENCAACGLSLAADATSQSYTAWDDYTAWDEIDLAPPVEEQIGRMFRVTRHHLLEASCPCGHVSRAQLWRAAADAQWDQVELGEWRLLGPQLAGVIVFLALRLRLSRPRIREGLMEWFGLMLSVGVIDETIREAGLASLPLEDALVADLLQEPQLNVDETSWPENAVMLWLWALVTTHTVLFLIGPRSAEMLENALQDRNGAPAGSVTQPPFVTYRAQAIFPSH